MMQMNAEFRQQQWSSELIDDLRQLIRLAVREDLSDQHDWTTLSTVATDKPAVANVVARASGVACGVQLAEIVFAEMNISGRSDIKFTDGVPLERGTTLMTLCAPAADLLTSERIILNFLGRLCGIATQVARYVEVVAGTNASIYDTRKTTPGWRRLEKYAVHCGGGMNHRSGLFDAVLIKDNHLAACAESRQLDDPQAAVVVAINSAREFIKSVSAAGSPIDEQMPIEIEVDTLAQLAVALPHHPDIVLLDNMPIEQLRKAVAMRDELQSNTQLEASGGVTYETLRDIAETGVDRISVGALTHSPVNLDIGLDWVAS